MGLSENQFVVVGAGQVQKRKELMIHYTLEDYQILPIWAGELLLVVSGYEKSCNHSKIFPERMRAVCFEDLFLLP